MARPSRRSTDSILGPPRPRRIRLGAAPAHESAARGFAGARVDRIARRARVNKAMLYYHFGSKQSLYRALIRQIFTTAADRLRTVAAGDAPPERKVEQLVAAFAAFIDEHAHFPSIMLRE